MKKSKLTLIIPAYNEEKIIKETLEQGLAYLSKRKPSKGAGSFVLTDENLPTSSASAVPIKSKNNKLLNIFKPVKSFYLFYEFILIACKVSDVFLSVDCF